MIVAYQIIWSEHKKVLEGQVNKLIDQGWQPYGSLCDTVDHWSQVMIKKSPKVMVLQPEDPEDPELDAFIAYLERTLIPDLRASGTDATAEDFETCVKYLKQL